MKLIGVTLLSFWLGICIGSENRLASINGHQQLGNEFTNSRGSPAIDGIPGFVYDAGLRQKNNGLRRKENGFLQEDSRQGINGQSIDLNSATDDTNILTQRFKYQTVSSRNEVDESPSPAMSHFQVPGIKYASQDTSFQSQNNAVFKAPSGFPQTSVTGFQESDIRQPSSATGFSTSELRQSSESSGFRPPSQQFENQEAEFRTRTNDGVMAQTRQPQQLTEQETDSRVSSGFQPSSISTFSRPRVSKPFESTPTKSKIQVEQFSLQSTDSQSKPSPQPQRFETTQGFDTKTISQFPQTIESTRTQVSETTQHLRPTQHSQISQSQRFAGQEIETEVQNIIPEKQQPVTQFQEYTRQTPDQHRQLQQETEVKARPQFSTLPDPRVQSPNGKPFQSQQFVTQETEVKSQPRFPPASAPSHFQTQPEQSFFQTQSGDTIEAQRLKEPETKARPQFSPSPVPRVQSASGQPIQPQQFSTQETEIKSQPRFPIQDQRHQLEQLPEQEIETKARPQFPLSPVYKVSDTKQTSEFNVEENENERQTLKLQQIDVRAQTRLPSAPSALQETKQPSVTADDRKFPAQQITSIESERKTETRFSAPKVSHFQAAGTRPIVRQESLSIPQRFQTNLFRDVGYASPPVQNRPNVALVRSHSIGPTDERAYAFIFESEDGIIREEQGGSTDPEKGLTAKTGSFSYISPDGTIVETTYIADERGYRTQSSPLARIHDPDLPAGKYDRYRSALASSQRNSKLVENQQTRTRV